MLRKLPGLIWTLAVIAFVVRRFVPPEAIRSIIERVQRSIAEPPTPPTDPAFAPTRNGAELHTPLPVA
jgi:hypothetical protein